MKILAYLRTFSDVVFQPSYSLFSLASAADKAAQNAITGIASMIDQIYLKSAIGKYLDRWAWDVLKMQRKPLECDSAFRTRILKNLFLANGTRTAIKEAIKLLTGRYPIEVFEPVRDTAYFNAGFYFINKSTPNSNASSDSSGPYCARVGTKLQGAYVGYVKVQLPGQKVGGAGLAYYDGREYLNALSWAGDGGDPQRLITVDDLCAAIASVKPAGTQVFLETY